MNNFELNTMRDRLINLAIATSSFVVIIALIPSLSQFFEIGWQPMFSLHILVILLLGLLFVFRKRINIKIKAHFLFVIILFLSIQSIVNFKTVNSAFVALLAICISTMIYGKVIGVIYGVLFLSSFSIIGYLHLNNLLDTNVDFSEYINNKTTWITIITGYAFIIVVLIKSVDLFYQFFNNALKQIEAKNIDLSKAFSSLELSEKRYMSIFNGSKDGFVFVDKQFRILNCNSSFQKLVGYSLDELEGKEYKQFIYSKDINWDASFLLMVASNSDNKREIELIHKSGELIPVEKSIYQVEYLDNTFLWAVVKDLREKKALERKVFSTMIYSEENERERYAKELHDGLGPLLSTSMIYLHILKDEQDHALIKEYSNRAYNLLEDATKTVKEISNNLSPLILKEYGLAHALRSFIEKVEHATQIKFSINDELAERFPEIVEFTLYRTFVELINNSLKYSQANEVVINFKYEQQNALFYYQDNGEGFDYESTISNKRGFGLMNIENRINKIGGQYSFFTALGKGVQVTIKLTINEND